MKRTMKWIVALSLLLLLTLAGCSNNEGSSGKGDGDKVVIRVATWEGGDGHKMQQEIAQNYMDDHPNVEIKVESVPDNYGTKILTQIAGGDAPDIFQIGDGDISMFQSRGALEDLTPFIEGDNGLNIDDFYKPVLDVGNIDGKYFTLPKDYSTYAVYYNKKLFDAAGIEYPTSDWTWDDFFEIAQKLTVEEDGETVQWGTNLPGASTRDVLPMLYGFGGDVISPDGQTVEGFMNSDGTKDALEFFNEMLRSGISPTPTQSEAFQGADLFLSEKVAMNPTGIWPTADYVNAGMDFGVVEVPGGPAAQKSTIYYSGYGIYSKSEQTEAAWDYLKYLSTVGQEILAEHALSAYVPAAEAAGQADDPHRGTFVKSVDLINMFPERLNPAFNKTAGTEFVNVLTQIVGNEKNASLDIPGLLDDAAAKGQEAMESEMEE
ncbi:sugar ABC transporter substrate-binding protein [Caldibacillus lycopersici]|uniref:Sugar ABC transporter substrate-binding protein n=1 Tax=Perspicuibacillus lycopersici TaxID=1325689 RepID=A0AAE3IRC6_9BACI|nr:sugar ABC transporter substrate-binding protein [Perspicuibacillus lycopersici]MCU9613175.1 sugar ABC transporter substrate-binding protein [Perspicuibacillus lycopersici]